MADVQQAKMMTRAQWEEINDYEAQASYSRGRAWAREVDPINAELDVALGAYMAGFDDPQAKAAAIERFDAALLRLREFHRKFDGDFEGWAKGPPYMFRDWMDGPV